MSKISAIKTTSIIVLTMYFNYIIKISSIKMIIETIIALQEYQIAILVEHDLFILARNLRYAINFLRSINFNSLNHNFKRHFIKIVFTNLNNLNNKDSYFSNSRIIKTNLRIKFRLLRLVKISYLKISIDLYYQISQQTRSFCSDLSSVFFKTTIIRFSFDVFSIRSNNSKLAYIIMKQTKTRILIKRIVLIRNITIKKIRNTTSRNPISSKSKTTTSKSFFFRSQNYVQEIRNANDII